MGSLLCFRAGGGNTTTASRCDGSRTVVPSGRRLLALSSSTCLMAFCHTRKHSLASRHFVTLPRPSAFCSVTSDSLKGISPLDRERDYVPCRSSSATSFVAFVAFASIVSFVACLQIIFASGHLVSLVTVTCHFRSPLTSGQFVSLVTKLVD